jgi:predicted ATPase/transcriptional regulator with XRE-family HTH domain
MGIEESAFNQWIKQRRRALDLTQVDLADCVGCSTATIQKIEMGERRPSRQVAQRLAECLHVPPDEQEDFVEFARGARETNHLPLHPTALPVAGPSRQASTPTNLPTPLTRLIGREAAAEAACGHLLRPDIRLLTLTGVPGVGKTRLSLYVAARLLPEFHDGVYFVELASIGEPELVASTIAATLGCKDLVGGSHLDWLKQFIKERRMLLILDNFEQILDAAPLVVDLLGACPALKVLVTSREALHIVGEQQFPLQPLEVPDLAHLPGPENNEALLSYPSVELFMQRAGEVEPGFMLRVRGPEGTPLMANYRIIAAICARLEGLPLAIELAAARVRMLTLEDLYSRLDQRLKLLTGGSRHLPARLQTLRAAIDWSYRLLSPMEQSLFVCLGVFIGGATLQAIEAVYNSSIVHGLSSKGTAHSLDVLEGVGSLVDKNLLRRERTKSRFTMLEMVREYALEKLLENGQAETIRRAHAGYFLKFAEEANQKTLGPEEAIVFDRLEEEHDNLRAALQWSLSRGEGNDGVETGLRLVVALGEFWYVRGYLTEGRERLASALARAEGNGRELKSLRAWALLKMADLAFLQADYAPVRTALEEALSLFLEIDDKRGLAHTLNDLADMSREEGNYDAATPLFEQSLSIFRELGDKHGTMYVLVLMSQAEMRRGFHAQATAHLEEALGIANQERNQREIALALANLGEVMILRGEYGKAIPLLEESLTLRRAIGFQWSIAASLGSLGWALLRKGDTQRASDTIMGSFMIRQALGDRGGVTWCLERLAEIEVDRGDPLRAARLLGAAKGLRDSLHTEVDIADRPDYDRTLATVRSRLDEEAFASAFAQGQAMSFEQTVTHVQAAQAASAVEVLSPRSEG